MLKLIFIFIALVSWSAHATTSFCPLRKDLAHMLMIGVPADIHDKDSPVLPAFKRMIAEEEIGALVFFAYNFRSSKTHTCLTKTAVEKLIRKLVEDSKPFIALDQEGGAVQSLTACNEFEAIPEARHLGFRNEFTKAKALAERAAKELRSVGVSWVLGPSYDVMDPKIPSIMTAQSRSYSEKPSEVARYAAAVARAFESNHLIVSAKHFPGHGAAPENSHFGPAHIRKTKQELDRSDWIPFAEAMKSNISSVMVGHLSLDRIYGEGSLPVSIHPDAIDDLLRKKFNYDGIVVTDDLDMAAIASSRSPREAALAAILAGNDVLLFRKSDAVGILDGLCERLTASDDVSAKLKVRIARSAQRLRLLKSKIRS